MSSSTSVKSQFVIGDSINTAISIFKKDWMTTYLLVLAPLLVAVFFGFISGIVGDSPLSSVISLISMVANLWISLGVIKGFLALVRGEKVEVNTFTKVDPIMILKYLGLMFLMIVIIFAGFLLFVIPGIYLSIKYAYAPILLVDNDLGPIDALKESAKLTDGVKWDMIGASLTFSMFAYIGIFALFVGLFITAPIAAIAYYVFYERLLHLKK